MNAQELFLDVSSGRFLDGESAIPISKPLFFSDEQRDIKISVLKVRNNKLSSVTPSPDSRFTFRLGTASLKLADLISVATALPDLFTASATVITTGAKQAVITASIKTYTPVTPQFIITLDSVTSTTPSLSASITTFSEELAVITGTLGSITAPNEFFNIDPLKLGSAVDALKATNGLSFQANLAAAVTATFVAAMSGGSVATISIINDGLGYPNGQYALTFSGGSPSVTASATAVALNGEVQSVSIVNAGSGYSSAPSVTLFTPDKGLLEIVPLGASYQSNQSAAGEKIISFVGGLRNSLTFGIPISFAISSPDTTATVTARTQAIATIVEQIKDNWTITITCRGYGYVSAPVVTIGDYIVPYTTLEGGRVIRSRQGTFSQGAIIQSSVPEFPFSQLQTGKKMIIKKFATPLSTNLTRITIGYPLTDAGDEAVYNAMGSPPMLGGGALVESVQEIPGRLGGGTRIALVEDRNALFINTRTIRSNSAPQISRVNGDRAEREIALSLGYKPVLQEPSLAGQKIFYTFTQGTHTPTRHALFSIEFNELKQYEVEQIGFIDGLGRKASIVQQGGGIFEPVIEEIDAGSGYVRGQPLIFTYIGGLTETQSFYRSKVANRVITLPPTLNTVITTTASVVTSFNNGLFNYAIQSGGFGYIEANRGVLATGGAISGGLVAVSITNNPKGYVGGQYICEVQASPSGENALVQLSVTDSSNGGSGFSVFVVNPGSGYTSAPLISGPAINFRSGFVSKITILNQDKNPFLIYRDRLTLVNSIDINVEASPVEGGSAEARLIQPSGAGDYVVQIQKSGFGYVTPPILTAVTPTGKVGGLANAIISNEPVGYILDKTYLATVGTSPATDGTAVLEFVISSSGQKNAYFINQGFGYTSVPTVTAPSPDAPNGFLSSVAIATPGLGYAPGTYQCIVTQTPSTTGQTAEINFAVDQNGRPRLEVFNRGQGYVTPPTVSVVTPSGNIISGITITCQGNFYTNLTAAFQIDDLSGAGLKLDNASVNAGNIQGIPVLAGGHNFSDNPKITFSSPTRPVVGLLPAHIIQGSLNITTASANAILTTANQRDILMEVFETDGTNEQVVAQATVSLAKRVLE